MRLFLNTGLGTAGTLDLKSSRRGSAIIEAGVTTYFYRRTMKRNKVKVERTIKMSGTDWGKYIPLLQPRKEVFLAKPREELYLESSDGLRLHAAWICRLR